MALKMFIIQSTGVLLSCSSECGIVCCVVIDAYCLFYRKRGSFEKIVHSDTVDWSEDSNRELLRAMMMTACDVAAITKPWEIQQQVCSLHYQAEYRGNYALF